MPRIENMSTPEILQYIKNERKGFISQYIDQEIMLEICDAEFDNNQWDEFVEFCDKIEENGFRGFEYLERWDEFKNHQPDNL
jgi:hypothetical protein